jgi:hypothetical protein
MRFRGRDIEISRRSIWMMFSVGVTMFGVAVLLSMVVRGPQSPIEADKPTASTASSGENSAYATNGSIVTQ